MLPIGQIKTGVVLIYRQLPHEVISASHLNLGRGQAKVTAKLRNLLNRAVFETTFQGNDRLEEAELRYCEANFLYRDSQTSYFMTKDDFATVSFTLPEAAAKFLRQNESVTLRLWEEKVIDVKIPAKVDLKIEYSEPGERGDTVSAPRKRATLETGATILVPLFIQSGEIVRVKTETGEYDGRV